MIILELCCIISQAQTPFDKFLPKGKTIPMLELKEKPIFRIENPDTNALLKYGEFIDDKFYFYGKNDNLLLTYTLTPTDKKWLSRDPKESQFPDKTPYGFVSGNPINRIDPDGQADYYLKDGTHAGNDGVDDNRTMTTTGVQEGPSPNGSSEAWRFNGARDMNLAHDKFATNSNIFKFEGVSNDPNEYLGFAHASNNWSRKIGMSQNKLLMGGYSSVKSVNKVPMGTANSTVNKLARAAMLHVLSGGADPTGGATHWDGTDFAAWGLNNPDGNSHAKFRQYTNIMIDINHFNTYTSANGTSEIYSGRSYAIPAPVFSNSPIVGSTHIHIVTGAELSNSKVHQSIYSTGTAGQSIFWKVRND